MVIIFKYLVNQLYKYNILNSLMVDKFNIMVDIQFILNKIGNLIHNDNARCIELN